MSYKLKRINPFWLTHPMIPTAVAIGGICGLGGFARDSKFLFLAGGVIAGAAILLAARPLVSAVMGTLGLLGGAVQFLVVPTVSAVDLSMPMRLVSVLLFGVFYMVLMDALALVVCVLYNAYAGVVGMSGVCLELEGAEEETPA
jgi:hypothetical protein